MIERKFIISWFFIALFFALIINEANLYFVKKDNPSNISLSAKSTVYGYTIFNVDNYWYLNQIKNYTEGKGFTIDPKIPNYNVRRSPGYPIFYGIHYLIFGDKYSFLAIRYTQLILFAFSIVLLGLFVMNITSNILWAKWTFRLFSFCPYLAINCYYTWTESVSVIILILTLFLFSLSLKRKLNYLYFFTGISVGCMMLIRPVLGLLIPAMMIALIYIMRKDFLKLVKTSSIFSFGVLLIMSPWVIRNYIVTKGELILFEKFYSESPMDYGKGQFYFQIWTSCWSNETVDNSSVLFCNKLIHSKSNEEREKKINEYVVNLPPYLAKINKTEDIRNALISLANCFSYKDSVIGNKINESSIMIQSCEEDVKARFIVLNKEFKSNAPIRYYIITPFNTFKEMVMNSSSNSFGSLNPDGRKFSIAQIVIKCTMYLVNILLYLSLFFFIIDRKIPYTIKILTFVFSVSTLAFFVLYVRYSELRYMLPIYPFLYISMSYFIQKKITPLFKSNSKSN